VETPFCGSLTYYLLLFIFETMCRVTRELPPPIKLPQGGASPIQQSPAPAPTLNPSNCHDIMIKTAENRIETKQAIISRSFNIYELGPVLKEGKFGYLRYGNRLFKSVNKENEFERSTSTKPVVLKVYSVAKMKQITANNSAIENPWLEIEIQQMLSSLNHLNLVNIIETAIVDSFLYIVLPFYSGGDLLDLLENRFNGPLPISLAKKMFYDICNGLSALHENGIIHRDLCIENIFYDDQNNTFAIGDYGMATKVPRDPLTGSFLPFTSSSVTSLCGKEGYIAPEIWKKRGEENCLGGSGASSSCSSPYSFSMIDGFACDIWSIGIILFISLTGSPPMQRAVEWDPYYQMIAQKRVLEMLGDCLEMNPEMFSGLELAQRILDVNPNTRPSASELLIHSWLRM
jgi:serine/threonine protein kinase